VPLNQQEFVCEQCGTTLKRLAPRRADDAHPAEAAPVPADDARSNRAVAWWKRRSLVHKAFIVLGIVIAGVVAWHLLASHNSARREADLSSQVKSSMQQNFDTDPRFTKYHLVVSKVDVLKQNGNQYQGMAIVHGSKGIDHEVPIDITAEGDKIIWHSEPGVRLDGAGTAQPVGLADARFKRRFLTAPGYTMVDVGTLVYNRNRG
jgi:hypothetical protein